ncbi:odorant receptor 85b-like [Zootermopsis nevadensis]|nr:odorant receptor 85b-like [Zootermopsis nevadensis]
MATRFFIGGCITVWMQLSLRIQKNAFESLLLLTESFTWEDQPQTDPDTKSLTMAGVIPRFLKHMRYVLLSVSVYHAVQSSVRVIIYDDLVFDTWYPFDTSEGLPVLITGIFQVFGTILMLATMSAFSGLYGIMMCVACSQLEKLRAALLDIKQETSEHEETFSRMQDQLNACIRHHQEIKRFMQTLEDVYSPCFCGLFLISLITFCFFAFSTVLSWGNPGDVIQGLAAYSLLFACVFIFCRLGTELTAQAESVGDSAWGCDWVGTPVQFQRCLAFVIATAQKEFTLTAGKFVPVSNTTMMNMLNQSVSLFMFLLQMKYRNDGEKEGKLI